MGEMSISAAFSWWARRDPGATAVRVVTDGARTRDHLTRAELDAAATRTARAWLARADVAVDDRVVVETANTVASVIALVAAWRLGATPVVVAPGTEPATYAAARPVLVVADADVVRDGEPDEPDCPLDDRRATSWKAVTTGGSTGPPKVVLSTGPATVDPQQPVAPYLPTDRTQLVAGRLHDSAPFTYALRGLMTGHTLVVLDRFDPDAALAAIAEHRVSWTVLAPSTMHRIARRPAFATADLSSLETLVHLGAPCPPSLKRTWIARLGARRVVEVYASSESAGIAMIRGDEWLDRPGSVGRGVGGTTFRVLGPDGADVPAGEVGEVVMTRPGGPRYRYLGAAPRPAPEGWTGLGDLGRLDDDGYLYLLDRADDALDVDGTPVYPARVEAVLETHPAVRSALVVGGPDGRPEALLDLDPGDGPCDDPRGDPCDDTVTPDGVVRSVAGELTPAETPTTARAVPGPLRDEAGKGNRGGY